MNITIPGGRSSWPRGKALGGSSLLNYMLYVRGHAQDYDEWASLGNEGWSYKEVLPFFKKSERLYDSELHVEPEYHGTDGPKSVRETPTFYAKAYQVIQDSLVDVLGLPIGDYNGKNQNVVYRGQYSVKNGRRADTYTSFAAPYAGKGLTVLTFAHATKVIMEGNVAKGVEVERFGQKLEYLAKNEVILSAGAIGSPQILMLSGIGPWDHLKDMGVPTLVLDKPGVGSNLQDHILLAFEIFPESKEVEKLGYGPYMTVDIMNYWTYYTSPGPINGPLSDVFITSGAFYHTPQNKDKYKRPDGQFHTCPFLIETVDFGTIYFKVLGFNDSIVRPLYQDYMGGDGVTLAPTLLRPRSKGTIRLKSNNPMDHPIIDPHYLEDPKDLEFFVESQKIAKKISDSKHFKKAKFFPKACPLCSQEHKPWTDEYYKCVAQNK